MIRVSALCAHRRRRFPLRRSELIVRRALRLEGVSDAAVSVVFVGDETMRRMNRRWLGHKGTTDVLSFPLGDSETLEGEVYVNLDGAARQAGEFGVTVTNEVVRLIVHGVLHLAGYEDRTPRLAQRMKIREDRLVQALAGAAKTR